MKEGWTYKTLGDITTSMADGPFGSNLKKEHYTDKPEVRIIQLSNIGEDGWREENTKYTTFQHLKSIQRSEVQPGDIVIAKMMPAGRAILCPSHEAKFVLSSDAVRATLIQGVNRRFVLYSINSPYFRKQVYENVSGSGRVRTSLTKLKACRLLIPGIDEQERIVERLDAAFAQIDELKSNAERQLAEARALFQSALTQAMQPKPGWQEKTLGEIANIIHGKNQKEVVSETGKYPIYGSGGNIMGYATDYLCEAGTTILGRKGSINNPQFINERFWNVDTAFGISAKEDNDNKFIYYFIKSVDWSKKNTGTTLPSLTQSVVKSVNLFVPNLTDQQTISSYLDSLHAQILEIDRVNKRTAAECDAMKQALLRQIFE